jgi:perosamine synthetase
MKAIPVGAPNLTEADRQAVLECLETGWISSEGPQVAAFEERFSATLGRRHGVAVSSGTAGLDIAVRALGLGPGDEVLVPSLSIISCARAIVESGARPVPVDCDAADWNARLDHFQERRTSGTKAILLVHLYGLSADLDPILSWAREQGLAVIEDASQALGLRYRDRPCGSFGDISVFSLYANKVITTGEGGMVLCDSLPLAEKCRALRNLCFDPARRFWHQELGWNYRLTALQAALGIPQLTRLPDIVRRKRQLGLAYHHAFQSLSTLVGAPSATEYALNVYWAYGLVVAPDAPFTRDELTKGLQERGIGTRTFFYGLHQQPALLKEGLVDTVSLPVTELLSERGFYLPSGLGLSDEDQHRVIHAVEALVSHR